MISRIDVIFAHDFDSNLYMLSKDADAVNWRVIVHCDKGRAYTPAIEKFSAYPGCAKHEDRVAWPIEYYLPEKIEIKRPGRKTVILKHPDYKYR